MKSFSLSGTLAQFVELLKKATRFPWRIQYQHSPLRCRAMVKFYMEVLVDYSAFRAGEELLDTPGVFLRSSRRSFPLFRHEFGWASIMAILAQDDDL